MSASMPGRPKTHSPMTPERMREIRERACLTPTGLGHLLDRSRSAVHQMEMGRRSIPPPVAQWLLQLDRWLDDHPAPPKSR